MKINRLFWQKLIMAFVVAFFSAFIPLLTGIGQSPDYKFDKALWISTLVAALGAGIRAVIALSPLNIVPSDSQHTLIEPKG